MISLEDKELIKQLHEEIKKTSKFLELLKQQFKYMELIRFATIYIAVLITVIVIWFIWYT